MRRSSQNFSCYKLWDGRLKVHMHANMRRPPHSSYVCRFRRPSQMMAACELWDDRLKVHMVTKFETAVSKLVVLLTLFPMDVQGGWALWYPTHQCKTGEWPLKFDRYLMNCRLYTKNDDLGFAPWDAKMGSKKLWDYEKRLRPLCRMSRLRDWEIAHHIMLWHWI